MRIKKDGLILGLQERCEHGLIATIAKLRTELLTLAIFLDDDKLAKMAIKMHILPPCGMYHIHHFLPDVVGIVVHHHTQVTVHGLSEVFHMTERLACCSKGVVLAYGVVHASACSIGYIYPIWMNDGSNPIKALVYGLYISLFRMQGLMQLLLVLRHEDDAVVIGFLGCYAIIESLYN